MSDTENPANRRRCSACKHSDHEAINTALEKKVPLREIARRFGVSKDAARRHRAHVTPHPDPLTVEIPPCIYHCDVPHRLQNGEWVCGECNPWDGRLAYWRMSGAPLAQEPEGFDCDEYRDKWVMIKA